MIIKVSQKYEIWYTLFIPYYWNIPISSVEFINFKNTTGVIFMNHAIKLDPLQRVSLLVVLVFVISCSVGDTDPPAPIEDLSFNMMTRQLNWTATGNDGNRGTATIYDLRFSMEENVVAEDFANATHIENLP